MARFVLRRLLAFPLVLWLANFIGFTFAFYVAPIVAASNPYSSGNALLPPLIPEYAGYLLRFRELDFGMTHNGVPVLTAIADMGVNSLGLVGIALFMSIVLGILFGRLAVKKDQARVSSWLTLLATVGLASPSFYVAILLITFFLLLTLYGPDSLPVIPFLGFGWDTHLILPVLALMIQPTVKVAQVTAGMLSDELQKPYVVAGLSFGHSFRTMKGRFAFRGILASVILTIAASLRLMMAELIIIERLFNWPGLGRYIGMLLGHPSGLRFQELMNPPVMAALLTVLAAAFLLTDLIAVLLSRLVDPRLRADLDSDIDAAGGAK